jgi:hypothetical protein
MNKSIRKFLEFKGKTLLFLSKDGIYWIAIKPVCEAIGVEYTRAFKNVKEDTILGPALAIQPMQVPGDQVRSLSCLPEYLIYGWLFSIHSESPELLEYKKECYKVMYDFFHGTITNRRDLLREKALIQRERQALEIELRQIDNFTRFNDLKAKEARLGISLKQNDNEEFKNQMNLFDEGSSEK